MYMKKLSLMIATVILMMTCSCGSYKNSLPKHGFFTGFLDYSKYAESGFFITESNTVPFDYVSIGSLSVLEKSGTIKGSVQETVVKGLKAETKTFEVDDLYAESKKEVKDVNWIYASDESVLEAFVQRAKSLGANGVVNLKFKHGLDEVEVSGMIIKR